MSLFDFIKTHLIFESLITVQTGNRLWVKSGKLLITCNILDFNDLFYNKLNKERDLNFEILVILTL